MMSSGFLRRPALGLGCFKQAILVLRWLLDGTRITQLAVDNQLSQCGRV
jgi:hypothetical protein